jgi:hypothetical protein
MANPTRRPIAMLLSFTLLIAVGTSAPAVSRDLQRAYPRMAPLDQYLIAGAKAEIALARSAAPTAISNKATIYVLLRGGYQSAIRGTNGFACLVERSWMSPFDSPEFWNPRIRGPICYNPAAVRSILPYTFNRTNLAFAGLSKAQMRASIGARLAQNGLPAPAPGAMSYMMSKGGDLGDAVGHWYPHLMFHLRTASAATWGANVDGSPVMFNSQYRDMPEQETIFMVPVGHWSDGSAAPPED